MDSGVRLDIHNPDGTTLSHVFAHGVYSVGSDEDNKIILTGPDVSGRHAALFLGEGARWVEDLASRTGTSVEGKRIEGRMPVRPGDTVAVGRYRIVVGGDAAPPAEAQPPRDVPEQAREPRSGNGAGPAAREPTGATDAEIRRSVKRQVHEELVKRLNLKRLTVAKIGEEDLHKRALATIRDIVAEVGTRLPPGMMASALAKEVYDEAVGLGPLEDLLADPEITEIMVNGPDRVYVEKRGKLTLTSMTFLNDDSVLAIIERIVSPLGRRIDESQPYVDARLKDGSRVNAIIHPLSLVGPCVTIRKFSKTPFTDRDMIAFGTMNAETVEFARACVMARKNIVISGGTGSGKTTLLNVFSGYLPSSDRIVTIEDAAELRMTQEHVIRLEARPPNIEGKGAVTIRDLVRNSLRMRPDRIVVGECRGGEALDMLQAMNTGHDGSLTTIHANSPRDVISRLETMVLMSGMDLPVRAVREQIASAIHVIFHVSRFSDGTRKLSTVSEVVGLEGDRITMQEIFRFNQTGIGEDGKVIGAFVPCGAVPTFVEEFEKKGIRVDHGMFDPKRARQ